MRDNLVDCCRYLRWTDCNVFGVPPWPENETKIPTLFSYNVLNKSDATSLENSSGIRSFRVCASLKLAIVSISISTHNILVLSSLLFFTRLSNDHQVVSPISSAFLSNLRVFVFLFLGGVISFEYTYENYFLVFFFFNKWKIIYFSHSSEVRRNQFLFI